MKEDVRTLIAELNRLIEAGEVSRKEVLSELKGKKGPTARKTDYMGHVSRSIRHSVAPR